VKPIAALLAGMLASLGQVAPESPHQTANDQHVQRILGTIAGRENEPAGQVFKNLKLESYRQIPARRLLLVMNLGFSRALGVACTHCHVEEDFAADTKRPKLAAREMVALTRTIAERVETLEHLESPRDERVVNCTTCHRGHVRPRDAQ
jgi:hypothetical protein